MQDQSFLNGEQGSARDSSGYPPSYYADYVTLPDPQAPLEGQASYDVAVIGGGYTGLSAALHLAQRGFQVCVLEARRIGWGASGRNGGQLCSGQRLNQVLLENMLGQAWARKLWQLAEESKTLVKGLIQEHQMPCRLTNGILILDHKARHRAASQAFVEKMRSDYACDFFDYLPPEKLKDEIGAQGYFGGVLDRDAGHLNPLGFAVGLAKASQRAGVRLYEDSAALSCHRGRGQTLIKTAQAQIKAREVILACNGYLGNLEPRLNRYILPIQSFILASEPLSLPQRQALIRHNWAVFDNRFVINYFRFSDDGRLLFGGGEKTGHRAPKDTKAFVRKALLKVFPQLSSVALDYAWGGSLGVTRSRMPFFRQLEPGLWTACGFSGHGLGMATLAGKLLAEALDRQTGRFDLMASLPAKAFPGGKNLRVPLLTLATQWFALRDRL